MSPDRQQAVLGPGGCLAAALAEGEPVMLRVAGVCWVDEAVVLALHEEPLAEHGGATP